MLARWKRIELMTNMEATNTKLTNSRKDEGMPETKVEKKIAMQMNENKNWINNHSHWHRSVRSNHWFDL